MAKLYPISSIRYGYQQGVMLLISLIALVALSMGGVAYMRAVDTGSLLAGNLAFSRASVAISDLGMETARTQLQALEVGVCGGAPCLENDQPVLGGVQQSYFWSNWQLNGFDYQSEAPWANASEVASPIAGFRVRYLIHRMCANAGPVVGNACVADPAPIVAGGGVSKGAQDYGSTLNQGSAAASNPVPYYRVTVRVDGPRKSLTYIQASML